VSVSDSVVVCLCLRLCTVMMRVHSATIFGTGLERLTALTALTSLEVNQDQSVDDYFWNLGDYDGRWRGDAPSFVLHATRVSHSPLSV
jgi:hypothetical protein